MIPSPSYQTPSLASVLATLAAYAPPPLPPPPLLPPSAPSDLEEGEYDPSEPPTTTTNLDPRLQPPQPRPAVPPFQPPALTHPPSPAPTPSPSKITTWPPALRHVTRYLVPNPDTVRRIGHLIRSQHQHERQWWAGREALVQKLEGREEGRRKLNSVLASVGGAIKPITSDSTPSSSSPSELTLYDRKVHRACVEMSNATASELARLGVPFFGLDGGLVGGGGRSESGDVRSGNEKAETEGEGGKGGKITRKEVEELKGRMLVLLEDLCGEE